MFFKKGDANTFQTFQVLKTWKVYTVPSLGGTLGVERDVLSVS
jgi:hypothetical protein